MLFKNSTIGIASMLFFVVLVSQSRILDFLFETFLGRILLISMILFISYTHYILGVVSVLLVIILFNNFSYDNGYGYGYGYSFMEGMENAQKPTTTTTVPTTATTTTATTDSPTVSSSLETAMNKAKDSVMSKISVSTTTPSTSTTGSSSSSSSSKKEKTSTEGFDLIGTENTIKRGKQSNSIPVHSQSNSGGRVAPYDGGSVYSAF